MCCRCFTDCFLFIRKSLISTCCCCSELRNTRYIYLLDPEKGSTTEIAMELKRLIDVRISIEPVATSNDCTENYPIALVVRRQTDRLKEDIKAKLTWLPTKLHKRTMVVFIHVYYQEKDMLLASTQHKLDGSLGVGIVLDFWIKKKQTIDRSIRFLSMNRRHAIEGLNSFVLKTKSDAKPNYNSIEREKE